MSIISYTCIFFLTLRKPMVDHCPPMIVINQMSHIMVDSSGPGEAVYRGKMVRQGLPG